MSKVETNEAARRSSSLVDPKTLMRIKSLELRAKLVMEGFWNGLHRSPYHGFSVEFTEYRQYSPGDDPRYLDWKLYARTDKYYVKRFEDETNLRCYLLVDRSASMDFGSLDYTKADYSVTLAATFAYFLSMQRDAVGLMTFADGVQEFIGARYRPGHLRRLMLALERSVEANATDLVAPLEQAAELVKKRGVVVFITDFLAPTDELETRLGALTARGHEVVLFHVLDPAEVNFNFTQPALFEDLETGKQLYVDPAAARDTYLRRLKEHFSRVQNACDKL
ncbi:MAG: DUF58 domain-containing protein, partial [Planctomycetales bacterium]